MISEYKFIRIFVGARQENEKIPWDAEIYLFYHFPGKGVFSRNGFAISDGFPINYLNKLTEMDWCENDKIFYSIIYLMMDNVYFGDIIIDSITYNRYLADKPVMNKIGFKRNEKKIKKRRFFNKTKVVIYTYEWERSSGGFFVGYRVKNTFYFKKCKLIRYNKEVESDRPQVVFAKYRFPLGPHMTPIIKEAK